MLRTIQMGSCVFIQGTFVRVNADGRVTVQVGEKLFTGQPVAQAA